MLLFIEGLYKLLFTILSRIQIFEVEPNRTIQLKYRTRASQKIQRI